MTKTFTPAPRIGFDVEMTEHDDFTDTTMVRVTRSDDNRFICAAAITPDESGVLTITFTDQGAVADDSRPAVADAILDAVDAEMTVHQSAPEGHKIETLRDLFAVCVPCGEMRALTAGYAY